MKLVPAAGNLAITSMLALCMHDIIKAYYAQNYAGQIGTHLT